MKVAVFGATGGTGSQVVQQALGAGHDVTAVVRRPGALAEADRLRVVVGSLGDQNVVEDAVRGQHVVISALGSNQKGPVTVCTDAAAAILDAMSTHDVRRLVAVSAYGAADSRDHSLYCLAVWASVGNKIRDKEAMEALIGAADVEATIVRPPALGTGPHTGAYRTGTDLRIGVTSRISRADLADFLLSEAVSPAYTGRAPRIAA